MTTAALVLDGVTKNYGSFRAVDELSLEVPTGSIYGFLGPNGSGKTTTLRIVLEILKPTRGTVAVLGRPSALEVRHRIGYLPEEKGLYKKMKAWAIIAYFASLKGLDRRTARARAYELLDRYGLEAFREARTEALSKGMQQKVQVLASIAHDPELVILDEPFSGLDPVNQEVMEEVIRDLARRHRTVLFSTHVMQHAERICDRILLISKGRKIFDGTVPEARRRIPRRVRIETADDIAPLTARPDVSSAVLLPPDDGAEAAAQDGPGAHRWELEVAEDADTQAILEACFQNRIRLKQFDHSEPSLHDVFVKLVGADAREAGRR
ncbi:MAG: ATP-binding cassette domain-containing protein [Planctomycetes bacterium]|nr:ATP-binding cassette domain-containing protein [Planctomycetota bacterium]